MNHGALLLVKIFPRLRRKVSLKLMGHICYNVRTLIARRYILNVPDITVFHIAMCVTWSGTVLVELRRDTVLKGDPVLGNSDV